MDVDVKDTLGWLKECFSGRNKQLYVKSFCKLFFPSKVYNNAKQI